MTLRSDRTDIQPQPEDGMWAALQVRIDDRFTPQEKLSKFIWALYWQSNNIILKIIFDIFHDTLPLNINWCTDRAVWVNAQRANARRAGWGSMANIIALKTATLVLSCS